MAPLYKKALIIGATSGIGEALAAKLIETGTPVIITGRRQDRLDAFVAKHGATNATAINLDVTALPGIPTFAASVIRDHPDLDCVVLNSGIQRAFDFSKPGSVDLATFDLEFTTNYTAFVHLTTAFLPHFLKTRDEGRTGYLVYVSASLGLAPTLTRTPGYNASKAALHSYLTNLRQQLKDAATSPSAGGSKAPEPLNPVRVIEVFPPAVQTEIHDEKHQPDLKNGGAIGMPLGAYIDAMYGELLKKEDEFAIGPAEPWLKEGGFEGMRKAIYKDMHPKISAMIDQFKESPSGA